MKKFLYFCIGSIAAMIAFILLLPMIGLLFSGLLLAAGLHYYTKSTSLFGKIMSATVALAGVVSAISNIPAFIGLVSIAIAYFIYKNWNSEKAEVSTNNDPFTNFEREWAKLTK
ncbi:ABC transporter permease [Solibacillus sp. CAU 1738]|uniref:lmo0954 family membrane protein n=1 Tax=Solibacillus sp. CAU 1738 TaxID=3140363 RepID=UPI003260FBD1